MKKFLIYILILAVSVGFLGWGGKVKKARAEPLGNCVHIVVTDSSKTPPITQTKTDTNTTKGWCDGTIGTNGKKPGEWTQTSKTEPTAPLPSTPTMPCTATEADGSCLPEAGKDPKYYLLEPLPCEDGDENCVFNKETEKYELHVFDPTVDNNLGVYLNMMFRLFLGICAVLAVIMIVMGGIEYMTTELISNKEAGKERITHAIFGLLLAFGAWTLLNTINPNLLVSDLSSLEDVTLKVIVDDSIPQSYDPGTKKYKHGATFEQYWGGAVPALPQGVKTNYPGKDCATVGQDNCTSIKGLDFSFINTIQSKCPNKCGELTITGGTEFWLHGGSSGNTSHGQGSPTIDLRPTDPLNLYIKSGKQIDPKDPTRWTKDGISYFFEGDHWHVYK